MSKSSSSRQEARNSKPNKGAKTIGKLTFVFLLVFLFIYGFLSQYYNQTTLDFQSNNLALQTMQSLFTLIGFGLLLTKTDEGRWTGMSLALFVVSFNFIFSPLIQQMWTKIFLYFPDTDLLGGFIAPNAANFWDRNLSDKITTSYLSFRLSNVCSISFLVGLTGYSGRINLIMLLPILTIYNFLFYMNFYLNILLSFSSAVKDSSLQYLDDFGTYLVYLFGGIYGLIVSFMTKNNLQETRNLNYYGSPINAEIRLFGAFILFSTFIFTKLDIIDYTGTAANYKFNASAMFILFSLITSILGNAIVCIFLNGGKILYNSIAIGVLSGGIISGALAGEMENIGAACILGLISGIISGAFMSKVHPIINKKAIVDEQGLIGPVLVNAFVGTFIVPPSILDQYFIRTDLTLQHLNGNSMTVWQNARYQLAYFAVTIALGLITGLIGGVLTKKTNNTPQNDFSSYKFFIKDHGLYSGREYQTNKQIATGTQHQLKPDVI